MLGATVLTTFIAPVGGPPGGLAYQYALAAVVIWIGTPLDQLAALRIGEVRECITAHPVMKRLPEFPWPMHLFHLDAILPALKPQIIAWRCAGLC